MGTKEYVEIIQTEHTEGLIVENVQSIKFTNGVLLQTMGVSYK